MSSDTAATGRPHVRRSTTGETPFEPAVRPWELELLISGAVTFALLQLPPLVDGWYEGTFPRMDRGSAILVTILFYYAKLIIYVLTGGFGVHLAARAYWVGLIGLESVFPHGIRWEATQYGPVTRDVFGRRVGELQPLIDRADRFCSMIFSGAFALVAMFAYTVGIVLVTGGGAWLASRMLFGGRYLAPLYFAIAGSWIVFSTGLGLADRYLGARLPVGGAGHRFLRRAAVAVYYLSGMPLFGAVWMILFTNLPRRAFFTGMYAMVFGLAGIVFFKDILLRSGALQVHGYDYLPEGGARTVNAGFYENRRSTASVGKVVPTLDTDVVEGPYVRLFIPYAPRHLNPAIRDACPDAAPVDRSLSLGAPDTVPLAAQDRVLECLARLQPVRLNGEPLQARFHFFEDPSSRLRGRLAYISAANLRAGENVLEVPGVPRPRGDPRPARPAHRILFWR